MSFNHADQLEGDLNLNCPQLILEYPPKVEVFSILHSSQRVFTGICPVFLAMPQWAHCFSQVLRPAGLKSGVSRSWLVSCGRWYCGEPMNLEFIDWNIIRRFWRIPKTNGFAALTHPQTNCDDQAWMWVEVFCWVKNAPSTEKNVSAIYVVEKTGKFQLDDFQDQREKRRLQKTSHTLSCLSIRLWLLFPTTKNVVIRRPSQQASLTPCLSSDPSPPIHNRKHHVKKQHMGAVAAS